jgi:hypothetical protein
MSSSEHSQNKKTYLPPPAACRQWHNALHPFVNAHVWFDQWPVFHSTANRSVPGMYTARIEEWQESG